MEGIYKVNIVPNDLCTEETIYQVADTLDNLNHIVDDVFTRLLSRIQLNVDRTLKLKHRIDISKEKVDHLATMQKAIKVFSSAKYPINKKCEYYQSILDFDNHEYKTKSYTLSHNTQKPLTEKELQVFNLFKNTFYYYC